GRVDRMLRDSAAAQRPMRGRRPRARRLLAAGVVLAAAAAAALAFVLSQTSQANGYTLRTTSGRSVGQAVMGHADGRNASLALVARGLPVAHGHVFVLWAGDGSASMQVGRFMADRSGGCRARFNLPASHRWNRFWVTEAGKRAAVVATS